MKQNSALQQPVRSAARWCFFIGVIMPALVYCARRELPDFISWPLPAHPQLRQQLALIAAGVSLALLQAHPQFFVHACDALGLAMRRWRPWSGMACVILGGGVLGFTRFAHEFTEILDGQPRTVLAGDGSLWASIIDDPVLMTSEPFGRWLPRCVWLLGQSIPISGEQALRLTSVLAGVTLLVVLLHYLPRLVPRFPGFAAFSLIFFSPLLIFFCGYPENTPFAYVLCMAYLLAAIHWLRGGRARPPWIPSLLLMLAMATHGAACFLYPAHCLLVVQPRFSNWRAVRGWFSGVSLQTSLSLPRLRLLPCIALGIPWMLFALCLLAVWVFPGLLRHGTPWYSQMFGGGDDQMFVSLWQVHSDHQDTLFGARHLRNLANLLLAMGPFLLILPRIVRDLAPMPRERSFLLAALGGLLALAVLWNPDLGLPRDLDLFAFFALPLQVFALLWFDQIFDRMQCTRLALQSAVSNFVFCVLPFLK